MIVTVHADDNRWLAVTWLTPPEPDERCGRSIARCARTARMAPVAERVGLPPAQVRSERELLMPSSVLVTRRLWCRRNPAAQRCTRRVLLIVLPPPRDCAQPRRRSALESAARGVTTSNSERLSRAARKIRRLSRRLTTGPKRRRRRVGAFRIAESLRVLEDAWVKARAPRLAGWPR